MSELWSAGATVRSWRSGPWSAELRDDELADIRFDGRLVLRSVRAVVRDRDWNTASWQIEDAAETAGGLELRLRSEGFGPSLAGALRIHAGARGLAVAFDAVSETEFHTNRTGLVVLHPPGLSGRDLAVRHADGSASTTRFPVDISPHQPVMDIAGLAWRDQGLDVEVGFAGDVFEMEDQRNWTDASFKSYSRPLSQPFPYRLAAGERVHQEVHLRVDPSGPAPRVDRNAPIRLVAGGEFPEVGVSASTAPGPAPAVPAVGRSLVVELDLAHSNWRAALDRAAAAGLPLDVRAVPGVDGFAELARALRDLRVVRVAAFHPELHVSDAHTIAALRIALADAGVMAPVVGGSRSHFTELNRERHRLPGDLDGLVTAVTPLFHALDTPQLVESVAMQRLVARQVLGYAAGRPVHIGPVALRPRFNNVATAAQTVPSRADLAEGYGAEFTGGSDDRQRAPELTAWTIASAAALAVPGVASLCFFEEWGPRGIRSASGEPYPVARAIEQLAALAGLPLLSGDSPDGLVWAVGAADGDEVTVLVANLDDRPREIAVELPDGSSTRTGSARIAGFSFGAIGLDASRKA
jgi:hypothetical protein